MTTGDRARGPADGRQRCAWAADGDELYRNYHDLEWGVPRRDDAGQFEFLTLESAQAGLSWAIVLRKREGYRRAFADFDPERVATFDRHRIDELLTDSSIIRNRRKIEAAVSNAHCFLEVAKEFGSFSAFIWSFVGDRQIVNHWQKKSQVPSSSAEAEALSQEMKKRGFRFVGPTILYAHMQATGLINDHQVSCFRHREITDTK